MKDNVVLRVAAKILFAPIILFGLYVQFHGDFGPGGGFQAGVIVAAAFILHALVFGLEAGRRIFPLWLNLVLLTAGVLIYGAVGVASMALNGLFLDYNVLADDPAHGQHLGILIVEFGVGLTVTTVMVLLFHAFAGFVPERAQADAPDGGDAG
jgi:multicomponent Na+:H+ antiporter subunit B